jgi:hypothetical protein
MYYDTFIDHLTSQGCSWGFDTNIGAVYHCKASGKGVYIKKENWLPEKYIKTACAELDVDVPPEISVNGNGFDPYHFIN